MRGGQRAPRAVEKVDLDSFSVCWPAQVLPESLRARHDCEGTCRERSYPAESPDPDWATWDPNGVCCQDEDCEGYCESVAKTNYYMRVVVGTI